MKQHTASTKEIDGNTFYIRPFPAFTAAHMSGELLAVLAPLLGGIIPTALGALGGASGVLDIDISSLSGALAGVSALNGDRVEGLLKKLLTKHKNISVETEKGVKLFDDDLANELFCGAAHDMFILAAEVISLNFKGFFQKIGGRFGLQKAPPKTTAPTPASMDA